MPKSIPNESFGNNRFDAASKRIFVTVVGGSSVASQQGEAQKRAVFRTIRREVRRTELSCKVLEVNTNSKLSSSEKQSKKDNLAIMYTMGSLDDNQSTSNVIQDLGVCNVFPPDTSRILLEEQVDLCMGCVPTYVLPPRGRAFRLYAENNAGVTRALNDPVTNMALPVQEVNVGPSSTVAKGPGPGEPYASITTSLLNLNNGKSVDGRSVDGKSVSVTVLDLRTDEIQTFTTPRNNLEVQECLQGVDPNIKPVRLDPSPAGSTYFVTTFFFLVQLVLFYTFFTPLANKLSSLIKNNLLNKFFNLKDSNEKNKSEEDTNVSE